MAFITDVNISFKDGSQLDGFGRIRAANPVTLFESKLLYDDQPLWWDESQVSGSGTSGTYNTNQASKTLAVSASTAGRRVRQSKTRMPYQPGKSQTAMLTFKLGAGATGIKKRVGLFDDNDGIFLERNGTAINVVLRSFVTGSAVDTTVAQASWNLDTLNGSADATNPSKLTLDLTKVQLLYIDFAWLGVSRVRIGFVLNGKIVYVHQFIQSNTGTVVFMSNPNLPIRYEISNDGTAGATSMDCICSTVFTEGGSNRPGVHTCADTDNTPVTTLANTNFFPLLAIRIDPTKLNAFVEPHHCEVFGLTKDGTFMYTILLNPTVTGTAFSWNSITNSPVQYARPTNATTVSGGRVITCGYGVGGGQPAVSQELTDIPLGSTIAGVSDVLVLAVQSLPGTAQIFDGLFHWIESI